MKKLLFINACVNPATSRTYSVGKEWISLLQKSEDFKTTELVLEDEYLPALTSKTLNERFALLEKKEYNHPVFQHAIQFRDADCIVIAAPYWDFGFPSILKTYIEAISVPGFAYGYSEAGAPVGLCKADKVYYVTTRGGFISDEKDLGYATIVDMGHHYGIGEIKCISVDGLDIPTTNVAEAINAAIEALPAQL